MRPGQLYACALRYSTSTGRWGCPGSIHVSFPWSKKYVGTYHELMLYARSLFSCSKHVVDLNSSDDVYVKTYGVYKRCVLLLWLLENDGKIGKHGGQGGNDGGNEEKSDTGASQLHTDIHIYHRTLSALPKGGLPTPEPVTRAWISARFLPPGHNTPRSRRGGAPRVGGRSPRPSDDA